MADDSIPTVPRADELISKAFAKANRVEIYDRMVFYAQRKTALAKLDSVSATISTRLLKLVERHPTIDRLDPWRRELLDLQVGNDKVRKALGGLQWCTEQANEICRKGQSQIRRSKSKDFISQKVIETYGRVASVVRQVSPALKVVERSRELLLSLPDIDAQLPTAVVAGYANVGKSALVGTLSTASPAVASYPFTTQEIHLGHLSVGRRRYQVIDTPGLLDRPLAERNDVERKAVLALTHLPTVIVYLIDPTGTSGATLQEQYHLLAAVIEDFPAPMVLVRSKSDLPRLPAEEEPPLPTAAGDLPVFEVSVQSGLGIGELKEGLVAALQRLHVPSIFVPPPWEVAAAEPEVEPDPI